MRYERPDLRVRCFYSEVQLAVYPVVTQLLENGRNFRVGKLKKWKVKQDLDDLNGTVCIDILGAANESREIREVKIKRLYHGGPMNLQR